MYIYVCIYAYSFACLYILVTLILLIFVGIFGDEDYNEISKDPCTVVWQDGLI